MRKLSIRIPDTLHDRLQRESKATRRKRSELVREAVGRYLEAAERRRFHGRMVRAAAALEDDPAIRTVAEELAALEAEALDRCESGASETGP